jgi:hypothetical protein
MRGLGSMKLRGVPIVTLLECLQRSRSFQLTDTGYIEDDIIVSNKEIESHTGTIWYLDSERKKRKYYPDIYLIGDNKIIEVKSEYTYKAAYSINIRKKQACFDLEISFEFWIYNSKGEKTIK